MREKVGEDLAAIQGLPNMVPEGVTLALLVRGQPEADIKGKESSLEMSPNSPGDLLHKSHGHIPVPGKNGAEAPSTTSEPAKAVIGLTAFRSLSFLWLLQLQEETGAWLVGESFARGHPVTSSCQSCLGCA